MKNTAIIFAILLTTLGYQNNTYHIYFNGGYHSKTRSVIGVADSLYLSPEDRFKKGVSTGDNDRIGTEKINNWQQNRPGRPKKGRFNETESLGEVQRDLPKNRR